MHPILVNLQADISYLQTRLSPSKPIRDSNIRLALLCKSLEEVFKHGLVTDSFHYFNVIEALAKEEKRAEGLNALIRHIINEIKLIKGLRTPTGRGRYFLRYEAGNEIGRATIALEWKEPLKDSQTGCCLNNGWINALVNSMRSWKDMYRFYHSDALLLRNPKESLMELSPQLQLFKFDLNLSNRTFLDYTWDLPNYRRFELVPTSDLGLMICSVEKCIIVSKVKCNSLAGEDGKVVVGDVIEEIDGCPTFGMSPEQVANLVKRCCKRPIRLGVVKGATKDGKVFPPLVKLYGEMGLSAKDVEKQWERKRKCWRDSALLDYDDGTLKRDGENEFDPLLEDEEDSPILESQKSGQDLLYIGSLKIGEIGNSDMLDRAIHRVNTDAKKVHHAVSIHLQELGLKMYSNDGSHLVLEYAYPEISACGCCSTNPNYLAFIAGNDLCPLATEYLCHVFFCANQSKAKKIISSIADGFQRTRDAV